MSKNWLEATEEKIRKNMVRKQHADALKNIYDVEGAWKT